MRRLLLALLVAPTGASAHATGLPIEWEAPVGVDEAPSGAPYVLRWRDGDPVGARQLFVHATRRAFPPHPTSIAREPGADDRTFGPLDPADDANELEVGPLPDGAWFFWMTVIEADGHDQHVGPAGVLRVGDGAAVWIHEPAGPVTFDGAPLPVRYETLPDGLPVRFVLSPLDGAPEREAPLVDGHLEPACADGGAHALRAELADGAGEAWASAVVTSTGALPCPHPAADPAPPSCSAGAGAGFSLIAFVPLLWPRRSRT